MKTLLCTIIALCTIQTIAFAQCRYVTIQASGEDPCTNTVEIAANETVELLSALPAASSGPYYTVTITKGERTDTVLFGNVINFNRPVIVRGPARIGLTGGTSGFCTMKIIPDTFPVDKTIVIPAGTTGATITLECSTNLIDWVIATNGFYSATNTSTFFRIRAERVL